MYPITLIEKGSNISQKKEAVFVAIYTESEIYRNYDQIEIHYQDTVVPLVMFLNRFDGTLGFLGGNIDPGETLVEALIREIKEESGYSLTAMDRENLILVSSHEMKNQVTHFYALGVDINTFKNILKNQDQAEHYLAEGNLFCTHFINYYHKNAFNNFMKNNFAVSVKEEVAQLIEHLDWDVKYNLYYNKTRVQKNHKKM